MNYANFETMTTNELAKIYRHGTDVEKQMAIELIVRKNDNLVLHIINSYFPSYIHNYIDDMRQEGRMAIFMHAGRFDPTRGTFSTFITPYIKDAIKIYLCSIHGITTHYSTQIKKYKNAINTLAQRGIENPTFGDIAEEMHVGPDAVQRVHDMFMHMNTISIEGDEKDKELYSAYTNSPAAVIEREEELDTIARAIKALPDDMKAVIRESFFCDGGNRELPLSEVAARLGMDVSSVRRLKNIALRRLQNSEYLSEYEVSSKRREIDEFSQTLSITFTMPNEIIDADIDAALTLDDDDALVMRL